MNDENSWVQRRFRMGSEKNQGSERVLRFR
jgi:hypothetical protein